VSAAWPAETSGTPLWIKLAAFTAAAIVATHVAHLALSTRITGEAIVREQEALGRGIAQLVAAQAADPVLFEDTIALDEIVARAALTPGVSYCFIVRDGTVLATSMPAEETARIVRMRGEEWRPMVAVDGERRFLDLREPILAGQAGVVRVGLDMAPLERARQAIAVPLWIVAGAAIVLSVLLAAFASRRVTRPVEEIIAAADRFDPAVPLEPIAPRGGREIAALARRFNGMTARLRAAHEEQERVRVRALANERLATLGSLVAAVAHEVNNPLAALKNAVYMLREDSSDPATRDADLDLMERAVDQIAGIVGKLLDFGRQRPLEVAPVSAAELARQSAELATMSLRRRGIVIDRVADPAFDDAPVLADRKEISQALLNLLLNAAYVTKDHDHVRVRLRARGPLRGIAVEDQGPGIPREIRDKVFDPFFSTKPAGQGTGLGLSVARTIADRHHGALEFDFPSSGGTVATLWLPTVPGGGQPPGGHASA
jgi:signal transduction histidine kinase